ncbi:MAG: UDP-glucose--hexose-1-phosphate uridylyltransferase [Lachnospiraceae bacterium]|nr:UDP-glucose--hexose-1-phosphate uridylyltransferase [Lachnospiraceae bacterium]
MIQENIKKLVQYGVVSRLTPECERIYTTNLLLDLFGEDEYTDPEVSFDNLCLDDILEELCDEAVAKGLCKEGVTYRDLFDTRIMNCLLPRPAQVQETFKKEYAKSPEDATKYFYDFSRNSNYIRTSRVAKNVCWKTKTSYGEIDITINLSKPEKSPEEIAAALKAKASAYPKCLLCVENEGYAGRVNHPARQSHRIMPITLNGREWGFQYSPYVYYNEHCIVLNTEHVPMKIDRTTFVKLFDFIKLFPHYFIGSNADLPIVGGSILTHDHFQGGRYTFAMEEAEIEKEFMVPGFDDVEAGIVKWPLSVIRLRGKDSDRLVELADRILNKWRGYTDEEAFVFAETEGKPHNTVTPIARMKDGKYELDLTLRNNITTDERPLGVFHPRPEYHNIKKENIGLIEVMGLAVLPARLATELEELKPLVINRDVEGIRKQETLGKHADWVERFLPSYKDINTGNVDAILQEEVGKVFCHVLEDAGVFKTDEEGRKAFMRFINQL